ncbi:hypothetical protein SDC9_171958 [bioreactor metagenome]|uniref:Uncharacterized protein n=1 Tax=bioreactor metagenome TaxID=1076179 RepID=A0A645GFJ8_9ZZZZ
MIAESQDGAAILHLTTKGDALRPAPRPEVPIDIPAGRRAGPKAPVVNVRALCSVPGHGALSIDPGQDGFRVFRSGEIVVDCFKVQKGEPVIVGLAIRIHACDEPSGFLVPE